MIYSNNPTLSTKTQYETKEWASVSLDYGLVKENTTKITAKCPTKNFHRKITIQAHKISGKNILTSPNKKQKDKEVFDYNRHRTKPRHIQLVADDFLYAI